MIVASYDQSNNQYLLTTTGSFGFDLQIIKSWKDIMTTDIIFCLDKQTVQEISNLYFVNPLETFNHNSEATYVFGRNMDMKLAKEIIGASEDKNKTVSLLTIPGKTLYAEVAMGIILYDYLKQKV